MITERTLIWNVHFFLIFIIIEWAASLLFFCHVTHFKMHLVLTSLLSCSLIQFHPELTRGPVKCAQAFASQVLLNCSDLTFPSLSHNKLLPFFVSLAPTFPLFGWQRKKRQGSKTHYCTSAL